MYDNTFKNTTDLIYCELIPTNKRLKQLVKEYGKTWKAISPICNPICFDGRKGIKIQSLNKNHERWVEYPSQIKIEFNLIY